MSDLARRVATALVLAPIVLGAVILGGWWFVALIGLGAVVAQWELYDMAEQAGLKAIRPLGVLAGVSFVLVPAWPPAVALATLFLLGIVAAELFRDRPNPLGNVAIGVFGAFYPAALLAWYVLLRLGAAGPVGDAGAAWLTVAVLVSVWAADTFAYFTGRTVGRRPLFKRISPKKTIEGTVGGVVGAVAIMVLIQMLVLPFITWMDAVVLGLIAGIAGPFGDLAESQFKRAVGVKDSGSLLPGHGGVLDRVDAMLVVGPLAVIYLAFVRGLF